MDWLRARFAAPCWHQSSASAGDAAAQRDWTVERRALPCQVADLDSRDLHHLDYPHAVRCSEHAIHGGATDWAVLPGHSDVPLDAARAESVLGSVRTVMAKFQLRRGCYC